MRLKHAVYICLSLLFIVSCKEDKDENLILDASKDAQIYSFSVRATHRKSGDSLTRAQDSIGFLRLSGTRFVIDQVTGSIYNRDSLPYGLKPEKVAMTVAFNQTYGINKFEILYPDSVDYTEWNRTDSVDMSKLPLEFRVTAPYGTIKKYHFDLSIHKVDPDIMVWNAAGTLPGGQGTQKVILYNDKFYGYFVSSSSVSLYTADKADQLGWEIQSTDLPHNVIAGSITVKGDTFYAINTDGSSFVSADGINWSLTDNGFFLTSVYGIVPASSSDGDELLVGYRAADGKSYFATTKDFQNFEPVTQITTYPHDPSINEGFPVRNFSSMTNYNRGGRSNMLILTGGINAGGEELNSTWLVNKPSANTLEITVSVRNSFFKGASPSIFPYDNYIYALAGNKLYRTNSWGELWTAAPDKQKLSSDIALRKQQNVIVDDKNYIWIFGGVSENGDDLKDIWRGRLNKLSVN